VVLFVGIAGLANVLVGLALKGLGIAVEPRTTVSTESAGRLSVSAEHWECTTYGGDVPGDGINELIFNTVGEVRRIFDDAGVSDSNIGPPIEC